MADREMTGGLASGASESALATKHKSLPPKPAASLPRPCSLKRGEFKYLQVHLDLLSLQTFKTALWARHLNSVHPVQPQGSAHDLGKA